MTPWLLYYQADVSISTENSSLVNGHWCQIVRIFVLDEKQVGKIEMK